MKFNFKKIEFLLLGAWDGYNFEKRKEIRVL
jgi:hypothetical protein